MCQLFLSCQHLSHQLRPRSLSLGSHLPLVTYPSSAMSLAWTMASTESSNRSSLGLTGQISWPSRRETWKLASHTASTSKLSMRMVSLILVLSLLSIHARTRRNLPHRYRCRLIESRRLLGSLGTIPKIMVDAPFLASDCLETVDSLMVLQVVTI